MVGRNHTENGSVVTQDNVSPGETKSFGCWKCGACCKIAGLTPQLAHWNRGDGACIHLQADNSCGIYETRPDVCRVNKMWEREFSDAVTWDKYIELTERACRVLDAQVNGA